MISHQSKFAVFLHIVRKSDIAKNSIIGAPHTYESGVKDETKQSYTVLAQMLKMHFGYDLRLDEIAVTNEGKPYIQGHPVHFNIAHSTDYIACAISKEVVGVDIEQPRNIPQQLHAKFMTDLELGRRSDPLQLWIIKEAYSKYKGTGTRLPFSMISAGEILAKNSNHLIIKTNHYSYALFFDAPGSIVVSAGRSQGRVIT